MNEMGTAVAQNSTMFYFRRINDLMVNLVNAKIKETELTMSQFEILVFIGTNVKENGTIRQKDIEEYFGLSHPTVIGILSRLRMKGLVTVTIDKKDKRHRDVRLTKKAHRFGEELKNYLQLRENFLGDLLSEDQIKTLDSLLKEIYNGMKQKMKQ